MDRKDHRDILQSGLDNAYEIVYERRCNKSIGLSARIEKNVRTKQNSFLKEHNKNITFDGRFCDRPFGIRHTLGTAVMSPIGRRDDIFVGCFLQIILYYLFVAGITRRGNDTLFAAAAAVEIVETARVSK